MESDAKIEIPLDKLKITTALILSLGMATLGLLFVLVPDVFTSPFVKSLGKIQITGIAALIFFSIASVYIMSKLFDNKPGLIIDRFGITDNTSALSIGFIKWKDITKIEKVQIKSTKLLVVKVRQPEKYISKSRNVIKSKVMKWNYKIYGSPITITSSSVKIDFDKLQNLILARLKK